MWKKLIASLVLVGSFSGCVTDKLYNAGKTVYVKGKAVVINNYDDLPTDVQEKLKHIDKYATKYDEAREEIRDGGKKINANGKLQC